MLASILLATAFQIGPFYEQKPDADYYAARPLFAREGDATDILWPVFTSHRDWWRFCMIVSWMDYRENGSYQFSIAPVWFNGRTIQGENYAALFPIVGHHPNIAMMYDIDFFLWPLYHSYRMPVNRTEGREWLTSKAVLFPFISWRSDGAWSFWPLYGVNYQRESVHQYALWPLFTWATYRSDRDTPGAGYSWTLMPLYSRIRREYEKQDSVLPPFFSYSRTWNKTAPAPDGFADLEPDSVKIRCPWPIFEYERTPVMERIMILPLYERMTKYRYDNGGVSSDEIRFGWRLVEIYDDEVRVFPFYASGRNHFRLWPFYESETEKEVTRGRFLSLVPIRWVPAIDRSWSKFWTFYESESCPVCTDHSLFWGLIRWRTFK